jgi:hypothetical protein
VLIEYLAQGIFKPRTILQHSLGRWRLVPAMVVASDVDPHDVLDTYRFISRPSNAIFITGGASNMSEEDQQRTRLIFEEGIAPFAHEHHITVIDGATRSGVIEMMASARRKGNYTFPLIGIAPHGLVKYEGTTTPASFPCARVIPISSSWSATNLGRNPA